MNEFLAESLARQLKIALEQVAREEYELLILRSLMESPLGNALAFKGGTALRVAGRKSEVGSRRPVAINEAAVRWSGNVAVRSSGLQRDNDN